MKKATGLLFVLLVIAMALVFSSAASAVPESPPNDNQCICHQTQHNKLPDDANANQKGVIICVDPNSITRSAHIKHGDACISPIKDEFPSVVAACSAAAPVTEDVCLGNEPQCTADPGGVVPEEQLELCCGLPEFTNNLSCCEFETPGECD